MQALLHDFRLCYNTKSKTKNTMEIINEKNILYIIDIISF